MSRESLLLVIALIVIALNLSCASSNAEFQAETVEKVAAANYSITGPYSHKNLTIFLLHGEGQRESKPLLTLQEAMEKKKVIVHETGDVNNLSIENVSDEEVYVQSGDIVKGGQQDRVLAIDLIVPPKSGKLPIESFCVEQGRWSRRGQEADKMFGRSDNALSSKELKIAAKHTASQKDVWDKVARSQAKLSEGVANAKPVSTIQVSEGVLSAPISVASDQSASSLQLTLENKHVKETSGEYIKKLTPIIEGKADVIGYAFAINGKINSADVYASNSLFKKLWPKLLESSAIEAIGELEKDKQYDPVGAEAVKAFLAESENGKASEKQITARVSAIKRETEKNLFFETRDQKQKGTWVHRNYIKK
jgi:ARG and Rhodanese-Phosphatase-superfamily-associated Protein domain